MDMQLLDNKDCEMGWTSPSEKNKFSEEMRKAVRTAEEPSSFYTTTAIVPYQTPQIVQYAEPKEGDMSPESYLQNPTTEDVLMIDKKLKLLQSKLDCYEIHIRELLEKSHPSSIFHTEITLDGQRFVLNVLKTDKNLTEIQKEALLRFLFLQYANPKVSTEGPYFDVRKTTEEFENPDGFFKAGDITILIGTPGGKILQHMGLTNPSTDYSLLFDPTNPNAPQVTRIYDDAFLPFSEINGPYSEIRRTVMQIGQSETRAGVLARHFLSLRALAELSKIPPYNALEHLICDTDPTLTGGLLYIKGITLKSVSIPPRVSAKLPEYWHGKYYIPYTNIPRSGVMPYCINLGGAFAEYHTNFETFLADKDEANLNIHDLLSFFNQYKQYKV